MRFNVEHDGFSIEYWKVEVAVFLPLPHPKNKNMCRFTECRTLRIYSAPTLLKALKWPTTACLSPGAICLWLGGLLLGKLLLGGLLLGELLLGGLLLSELLLHELLLGELPLDKRVLGELLSVRLG